jgi:hypothetical protein
MKQATALLCADKELHFRQPATYGAMSDKGQQLSSRHCSAQKVEMYRYAQKVLARSRSSAVASARANVHKQRSDAPAARTTKAASIAVLLLLLLLPQALCL